MDNPANKIFVVGDILVAEGKFQRRRKILQMQVLWSDLQGALNLGNHVKYECEGAKKAKESVKEKPMGEPPKEEKELEPRQLVAQFGRDGLNQIKRERQKSVLGRASGFDVVA